jgi:cytochrome c
MLLEEQLVEFHDYKYSKALASYGKEWTFEELNGFLKKPASY